MPPELLILLARLAFAALLYLFVLLVLLALRRELQATPQVEQVEARQQVPGVAGRHGAASAAGAAPAALVLVEGGLEDGPAGRAVLLPSQPGASLVIGRRLPADVVLADSYVSGQHARLRYDGDGWWLEDLHSRNGTFLNGRRLAPDQPGRLQPGDLVGIGQAVWRFDSPAEAGG